MAKHSLQINLTIFICLMLIFVTIPTACAAELTAESPSDRAGEIESIEIESKPVSQRILQSDTTPRIIEQNSFEGSLGSFAANYGGSDIYLDPTAQDGDYSLRFTFPTGFPGGDAPDVVSTVFPAEDEVFIRFYFKLSENFQWHPITQKLIYFRCGQWQLNDTNHMLSVGYWGNGVSVVTQHNTQESNQEYHWGDISLITKDVWHKIVMHVAMNTPGKNNGIIQVWYDDLPAIDREDLLWLVAADHGGMYEFQFTPVFGGLDSSVDQTMFIYFDSLIIQDVPFQP